MSAQPDLPSRQQALCFPALSGRETKRDRETDIERDRDRVRETNRDREKDRERHRDIERWRQTQRQRQRDRGTERATLGSGLRSGGSAVGSPENRYGALWVEGPDRLLAGGRYGAHITGGREDEEID